MTKIDALNLKDPEIRDGWRANIAMAIHDTVQRPSESIHAWRNRCAETFLERLAPLKKYDEDLPGMLGAAMSVGQEEQS